MLSILPLLLALPQMGAGQIYDYNGDVLASGPGSYAPGDVLNTLNLNAANFTGASIDGTTLLLLNGSGAILKFDEATGAPLGSVPILVAGDYGLGFDTTRNLYVTTNASSDTVSTYSLGGTLLNNWPAPGSGPVGAAYDPGRDAYWITDWSGNFVASMDATSGAVLTSWDLAGFGATRSAGVSFNAANDQVIVGSRDTGAVYVLDAATGSLVRTFAGQDFGSNDPHGMGNSSSGNVWQTVASGGNVYELDLDNGPTGPSYAITGLAGGGTATLTVSGATAGGGVLIGYSLTGAGPTNTPFGPVDMSAPITQLPVLTANGAGVASMTTGVPGRATGFTVYTQAADLSTSALTNSLAEVVL
jgi:hypothetical protein